MRISRLNALTFLLVTGVLGASAVPTLAAEITCGATLGPGGTFILTHDLTCPGAPDDDLETIQPALSVVGGAILDLNGHTVTCDQKEFGIAVLRATILNGTVKGCGSAVTARESVVTQMTLIDNNYGVYLQGKDDNLIISNIATGNQVAFAIEDGASRNTFIDNTARANDWGFTSDSGFDNDFIGNTAIGNAQSGFSLVGDRLRLVSNLAKRNGVGFTFDDPTRLKLIGNVAKRNETHGFHFPYFEGERVVVRDNVAQKNGGDGFRIAPASEVPGDPSANVFKNNRVLDNGEHGIHVTVPQTTALNATIRGNTVLGHTAPYFDLANDNPECADGAVWENNVFETASQACIE